MTQCEQEYYAYDVIIYTEVTDGVLNVVGTDATSKAEFSGISVRQIDQIPTETPTPEATATDISTETYTKTPTLSPTQIITMEPTNTLTPWQNGDDENDNQEIINPEDEEASEVYPNIIEPGKEKKS